MTLRTLATRFGLVGIVTALVYFFVLWLASSVLELGYMFGVSLAYIFSTTVHYFGNFFYTFRSQSRSHSGHIKRYIVLWLVNYFISISIVVFCVEWLRWPSFLGVCVAVAITVMLGFLMSKFWVFSSEDKSP
jgi:putative flippase GtrA